MDLERDAETNRTLYVSLLSRLKELERQDDVGQSDANFISRAAVPLSPSSPATKRIMAVALVARLVMAAILAFIAASMAGRIRTSESSEEHTSELQSIMRHSYAVFCLTKQNTLNDHTHPY